MTGVPGSTLAREADIHLDAGVEQEACPHNLAPTASTTPRWPGRCPGRRPARCPRLRPGRFRHARIPAARLAAACSPMSAT